ncbi:MAG: trans-aconitate 2-methyltransferase, partial [Enterobacterales bacterium]|nr:trans-aconitate 2-methyltransferase [Enterobacterales bacterium]
NQPSHALMRKVAAEGPWERLNGEAESVRKKLLTTEEYYDLLALQGCEVDIWRTTYYHVMPSASAIIDWLSSTGLRPFLDKLSEDQRPEFLRRYLFELEQVYTPRADGKVLLAFPRLFIVARNVENGAI